MDLGSLLFSLCIMMICLLGAARCSSHDQIKCCPEILQLPQTEPPPVNCLPINSTFRYKCIEGYLRKVGTSNLIRCKQIKNASPEWSKPSLKCIPDPMRTTTQPPKTTVTKGHTEIPHDSIVTTTVTMASISPKITQSISTSASVTAETYSTKPTSTVQQDPTSHSQAAVSISPKMTRGIRISASVTAETDSTKPTSLPSSSTAGIAGGSLVIFCALIGISFLCYRSRRSKNNFPPHAAEEQFPMNHDPSALVS
ncbi:interleukin-15 receptor subunit alpha isoform X2 [Siniperca chuatsi]|uniref:interleukin-15 receptor subunit alpha isoform X2 n=1 Tax=Siniperca chuatsi TaxID=119488 RepID=UPI001CE030B5|nr:interleukin-15 receptor subunit alpha isoform X2 [Siniperca chuatsi]